MRLYVGYELLVLRIGVAEELERHLPVLVNGVGQIYLYSVPVGPVVGIPLLYCRELAKFIVQPSVHRSESPLREYVVAVYSYHTFVLFVGSASRNLTAKVL